MLLQLLLTIHDASKTAPKLQPSNASPARPSSYTPLLFFIPTHNNPRPFWPVVGSPSPKPSPRERIITKIPTSAEKLRVSQSSWKYTYIRPRIFTGTSSESWTNFSFRNLTYTSHVRRLSNVKGSIAWLSKTAHHKFAMKRSAKLLSTVAWGFSSDHTRALCLLRTPSQLTAIRR